MAEKVPTPNHAESLISMGHVNLSLPIEGTTFKVYNILRNRKHPGWKAMNDTHSHHEIIYTLEGGGFATIEDKKLYCDVGSFFFIPRGKRHDMWFNPTEKVWETFVIEFDFLMDPSTETYVDNLEQFPTLMPFYKFFILSGNYMLNVSEVHHTQLQQLIIKLSRETQSSPFASNYIISSLMLEFLVLLCRAAREQTTPEPVRLYSRRTRQMLRLEKARTFIQQNVNSKVTIHEVSDHVAMSPYHFCRLFKKAFGVSPIRYQKELRMIMARKLLLTTDTPIKEIAYDLGFSSPDLFRRAFAERFSTTPSQYALKMAEQTQHQVEFAEK